MVTHTTTGSIFDDLGRNETESEDLKRRAALLGRVVAALRESGRMETQAAADWLGVSEDQADRVLAGRLSQLSADDLEAFAARAERRTSHAD